MCSGLRLGKLVWHSVVWRLRGWRRDYTHCSDPRQTRTWTPDYSKGWYWVAQARLLYVWWGSVNGSLQYCWHFIQERRRLGSSRLGWGAVFNKWLRHRSLSTTSWHPCACHFTIHLSRSGLLWRRWNELELPKSWRLHLRWRILSRSWKVWATQMHSIPEFLHQWSFIGPQHKIGRFADGASICRNGTIGWVKRWISMEWSSTNWVSHTIWCIMEYGQHGTSFYSILFLT